MIMFIEDPATCKVEAIYSESNAFEIVTVEKDEGRYLEDAARDTENITVNNAAKDQEMINSKAAVLVTEITIIVTLMTLAII